MPTVVATRRLLGESPAFGCYLLAVALLPFRFLSPLGSFYEHAGWTDLLAGVAALAWLIERIRDRDLTRALRSWQAPLALYLALACASMALAVPGFGASWKTVLLMAELAVLAVITADFATDAARRRLIARVIVASALASVALGAVALILFYADVPTGLVGGYGDLVPSTHYTRVKAGFESAPLLASFCIFASGVAASRDADLSARIRIPTQVSLGLLCAATISRAIIGFLLAMLIRWSAATHGLRRMIVPVAATAACVGFLAALTVGFLHLNPAQPSSISYEVPGPENPRRAAITSSLTTLGDHPLLGIGPGALPGLNGGVPFRAHLTPLNVAATQGIPALLALSAMFWLLWRSRRRPTDVALWSALAGIALDGLVGDVDHYRHLWILIGLLGSGPGSTGARPEPEPPRAR
jgi:hypothetical protein